MLVDFLWKSLLPPFTTTCNLHIINVSNTHTFFVTHINHYRDTPTHTLHTITHLQPLSPQNTPLHSHHFVLSLSLICSHTHKHFQRGVMWFFFALWSNSPSINCVCFTVNDASKAAQCALSYLLFDPDDQVMQQNVAYYRFHKNQWGLTEEEFKPRPVSTHTHQPIIPFICHQLSLSTPFCMRELINTHSSILSNCHMLFCCVTQENVFKKIIRVLWPLMGLCIWCIFLSCVYRKLFIT